ncbi:MAG TPA: SRPBCC family protein [Solirubrobacterales bacterium]|nr:SRPBCC family protein [Solirubrobacterales bacterium]
MKPVTVSTDVPQGREQVYAHIDVLANHEAFTDHMLVDWQCSGPASGVGARARMRFKRPGPPDWMEMEVVGADPPRTMTEEAVSAGGRRRTRGTYVLDALQDGGTRIKFRFEWLEAPLADRLLALLMRSILKRGNERAMRRLAAELERRD